MIDSYVSLDLETTGLSPTKSRILEIGARRVEKGVICGSYETLVNAGVRIDPRIVELTGITQEMAESGTDTRRAVEGLLEFCGDLPLLGHNIIFDYSFVKHNAVNLNLTFEKSGVDTLRIARRLLPDLEHKNLTALCAHYHIEQGRAHRAGDDAAATLELYRRLCEEFPEGPPELFDPRPLLFKTKKQGPITAAQKGYLNDLVKYHKIILEVSVETLTKNEASRLIDNIIREHGRIRR